MGEQGKRGRDGVIREKKEKGQRSKEKGKKYHRSNGSKVGGIEKENQRVKRSNHRNRKEWKCKVEYFHNCTASHNVIFDLC